MRNNNLCLGVSSSPARSLCGSLQFEFYALLLQISYQSAALLREKSYIVWLLIHTLIFFRKKCDLLVIHNKEEELITSVSSQLGGQI